MVQIALKWYLPPSRYFGSFQFNKPMFVKALELGESWLFKNEVRADFLNFAFSLWRKIRVHGLGGDEGGGGSAGGGEGGGGNGEGAGADGGGGGGGGLGLGGGGEGEGGSGG